MFKSSRLQGAWQADVSFELTGGTFPDPTTLEMVFYKTKTEKIFSLCPTIINFIEWWALKQLSSRVKQTMILFRETA